MAGDQGSFSCIRKFMQIFSFTPFIVQSVSCYFSEVAPWSNHRRFRQLKQLYWHAIHNISRHSKHTNSELALVEAEEANYVVCLKI